VQTVLEGNDLQTAIPLKENGFPKAVSLHYMSVSTQTVLEAPEADALAGFMHVEELVSERFEIVFGQVEENSLDCPELQGMFTAQEALEGCYRQDVQPLRTGTLCAAKERMLAYCYLPHTRSPITGN
jgi:hypothetical protein